MVQTWSNPCIHKAMINNQVALTIMQSDHLGKKWTIQYITDRPVLKLGQTKNQFTNFDLRVVSKNENHVDFANYFQHSNANGTEDRGALPFGKTFNYSYGKFVDKTLEVVSQIDEQGNCKLQSKEIKNKFDLQ